MKSAIIRLITIGLLVMELQLQTVNGQAYCNPVSLNYRSSLQPSEQTEVSDPSVVLYKDDYYLFASNAEGYWHSKDLLHWKLIQTIDLPQENDAPTAVVIDGWVYYFTSLSNKIYRSNDPANGKWELYNSNFLLSMISDFCVFADTDNRVYCYYACSNNDGLMARELDVKNKLNPKGVPTNCLLKNTTGQGWKRPSDKSKKISTPGVSGSWVNKYNGKYYYQFTEPDTEFNTSNEVVYVSDRPFGPFTYAAHNPFVSKPKGFVSTAGKGCTFADKHGNWWHIATLTAPDKVKTGLRIGLFPASFDAEGNLVTYTDFGDYPIIIPNYKYNHVNELRPGWSLLSFYKPAETSSSKSVNPVDFAFDENMGTFWSAQHTNKKEWLSVDLGSLCTINAVQLSFAENNAKRPAQPDTCTYQYLMQYSADKKTWKILIDETTSTADHPHPFEVMSAPVQARYVKITSYCMPGGNFAISGFRVFGTASCFQPTIVKSFQALKDRRDPRKIKLTWYGQQKNVTGYNIRYGTQKDKLYQCYQVYNNSPVVFHGLDKNKTYYFEIDAFGENGVSPSLIHSSH
ncbi:MAG TPA: family 43 glycosylhydrolase [Prolixibacteraceae bacterium]|nr:family 43 glycosylhydrolase [Prolixibacteraceae bacterium]